MTTMLSLDTSTTSSGVALWINGQLTKHYYVCTSKTSDCKERDMMKMLVQLIEQYEPDIVVCEDLNIVNNISVAKKLAALLGAIEGACILAGIHFDKMAATSWRKWVCGNVKPPRKRKEAKLWDIMRVQEIFRITPANDDEADAILIGEAYKRLCDYYSKENKE